MQIDIQGAQSQLSHLIDRACAGEDVVITRDSEPIVRLVPVETVRAKRQRGSLEGQVIVPDSFFDPLRDEELDEWER